MKKVHQSTFSNYIFILLITCKNICILSVYISLLEICKLLSLVLMKCDQNKDIKTQVIVKFIFHFYTLHFITIQIQYIFIYIYHIIPWNYIMKYLWIKKSLVPLQSNKNLMYDLCGSCKVELCWSVFVLITELLLLNSRLWVE